MKMPARIPEFMFAPCGMNCMVCYSHLRRKKPCAGCMDSDSGKPEHCRKCGRKACAAARGLARCYECGDFPCQMIKSIEKSYQKRYGVSLTGNSRLVMEMGLEAFMKLEKEKWICPSCGGIISLHDKVCSDCEAEASK